MCAPKDQRDPVVERLDLVDHLDDLLDLTDEETSRRAFIEILPEKL
ncbi:MAG: hypothetical protein J6S27_03775 [Thermoguttaceae bacterium]|nr:hypothetical protein [Thermoguttaceae bacterium]